MSPRRSLWLGTLLVLALCLSGCGLGGATPTTAPTTAPRPTTAPASGGQATTAPTASPTPARAAASATGTATPRNTSATATRGASPATRSASPRATTTPPAAGSWLDAQPVANWNVAGATVPKAPAPTVTIAIGSGPAAGATPRASGTPRAGCTPLSVAPNTVAERAVAGAGWTVFLAESRQGNVGLVAGLASYDGMCRPMQFQIFVFVNDTFAGTLSPQTMDSSADGVIETPTVSPDGAQIVANYLRYAANDASCCASRVSTLTFASGGTPPLVVPQGVVTRPTTSPTPSAAPASPTR
jgi:hypothetical protein